MDFDLVFGKMREMMRRDKPYQKKLVLVTIYWDIMKKHPKMAIFGLAEKCPHTLEHSFLAIIQFLTRKNVSKDAPRCADFAESF